MYNDPTQLHPRWCARNQIKAWRKLTIPLLRLLAPVMPQNLSPAATVSISDGMGRVLVIVGLVIAAIGLLWPWLRRIGLGQLPGDIYLHGEHGAFYFPITTCILVSIVFSLLWWLIHR